MTSRTGRQEPIIGDGPEAIALTQPREYGRGLDLSERPNQDGFGYSGLAKPFDDSLLIPRHQWEDRIEELEHSESQISDLIRYAKLPTLHARQARTGF